ncbi:LytR/AlgR family response regulator transcription factor [Croceiramulus getboli]|nr:LytTR family DNA-binding domain-containing protein [Flavobacteriaceae bacterium YJPT1-3]
MNLNALIVEDEQTSREILKNYLAKYCPKVTVIGEAANVSDALSLIRKEEPDLLFLDVEMPFGNAFDLLDQVGERNFEIIFTTAYDQYALEALNAHASYYLLKPLAIDELIKAVDFVIGIRQKEEALQERVLNAAHKAVTGKITIPQQDGFEVIAVEDILYCQADDNYTYIYLVQEKKKLVSKTLKYFEEALTPMGFVRVHKSYLINVSEVIQYKKGKGGHVVLSNGQSIQVSASKKANLLANF